MSAVLVQRSIFDRMTATHNLAVTTTPAGGSVTHRGVTLVALPERRVA